MVVDGGDAAGAGGEGRRVVAEDVLDGVGIVAGRGVGVGRDDGLALADNRRNRDLDRVIKKAGPASGDGGDRNVTAVDSGREGGGRGQVGQVQVFGHLEMDLRSGWVSKGVHQRGRGGVGLLDHGAVAQVCMDVIVV